MVACCGRRGTSTGASVMLEVDGSAASTVELNLFPQTHLLPLYLLRARLPKEQ